MLLFIDNQMSKGDPPRTDCILNEEIDASLLVISSTKVSFLQDERQRLEMSIS